MSCVCWAHKILSMQCTVYILKHFVHLSQFFKKHPSVIGRWQDQDGDVSLMNCLATSSAVDFTIWFTEAMVVSASDVLLRGDSSISGSYGTWKKYNWKKKLIN